MGRHKIAQGVGGLEGAGIHAGIVLRVLCVIKLVLGFVVYGSSSYERTPSYYDNLEIHEVSAHRHRPHLRSAHAEPQGS